MYLSTDQLTRFKQIENNIIKDVLYHFWVNKAVANDEFRFLEYIEIRFQKDIHLFITKEEETGDLQVIQGIDIMKTNDALKVEFNGLIKYDSFKATNSTVWKPLLDDKIISVQMEEEDGLFLGETVLLIGENGHEVLLHTLHEGLNATIYAPDKDA